MGAMILPSKLTQQPRQPSLGGRNRWTAGARGVIVGGTVVNLASGMPLVTAGNGVAQRATSIGVVESFRKNFYRKTEALAIGTASFIDIWSGIPVAYGAAGLATDAGFLTGSSNNLIGIAANGRGGVTTWGAVYNWPTFNDSQEVLPLGIATTIIVARFQDRMEFWRDGRMIRSFTQAPMNYGTTPMVIGAFLEDTAYWTSSNDTALAARMLGEWSSADLASLSINSWGIFAAPPRKLYVASVGGSANTPVNPSSGALSITGFVPTVTNTANQSFAPVSGSVALAGFAPSVSRTVTQSASPSVGVISISGYAPTISQAINLAVTPATGSMSISGYAPTVVRTLSTTVFPAYGALALVGYAPSVSRTSSSSVSPGIGQVFVAGYSPTVMQTAPVITVKYRFVLLRRDYNTDTIHFSG